MTSTTKQKEPSKFEKTFGVSVAKEPVNRHAVLHLQKNCFVSGSGADKKIQAQLKDLLETSQDTGVIVVPYNWGLLNSCCSSWVAGNTASLHQMSEPVRHTLSNGKWISVLFPMDTKERILLKKCEDMRLGCCQYLKQFVTDKDKFLATLVEAGISSKSEAQDFILQNLLGNSCMTPTTAEPLKKVCVQFDKLAEIFACADVHTSWRDECIYKPALKASVVSLNKRVMLLALEWHQKRCLEALFQFLQNKGCITEGCFVLLEDSNGIQIPDNDHNRGLLESGDLLEKAQDSIFSSRKFKISLSVEEYSEAISLPEGYDKIRADLFQTDLVSNNMHAVQVILHSLDELLVCNVDSLGKREHFFYKDGIFITGKQRVKSAVLDAITQLGLRIKGRDGEPAAYPRSNRELGTCGDMVLRHPSIERTDFHKHLGESSTGFLAFKDGIFSFAEQKLFPFSGRSQGPLFTTRIGRLFPGEKDAAVHEQLMDKVLKPLFPSEEKMKFFLQCLSRALAGHWRDKRWFRNEGPRDAGKSVLCKLLLDSFDPFVVTFDADKLVCTRLSSSEAHKSDVQKWMALHEYTRILVANEIKTGNEVKVDGSILKKMASGGDEFQAGSCMQGTLFINCNGFSKVDPPDACENMVVIRYDTKFVDPDQMLEMGSDCPDFFKPSDYTIKDWIQQPAVIAAFTSLVLESYTAERPRMPACVAKDTKICMGPISIADAISSVVYYSGDASTSASICKIKQVLENAGVQNVTPAAVKKQVDQMFKGKMPLPQYKKLGVTSAHGGKRKWGFDRIALRTTDDTDKQATPPQTQGQSSSSSAKGSSGAGKKETTQAAAVPSTSSTTTAKSFVGCGCDDAADAGKASKTSAKPSSAVKKNKPSSLGAVAAAASPSSKGVVVRQDKEEGGGGSSSTTTPAAAASKTTNPKSSGGGRGGGKTLKKGHVGGGGKGLMTTKRKISETLALASDCNAQAEEMLAGGSDDKGGGGVKKKAKSTPAAQPPAEDKTTVEEKGAADSNELCSDDDDEDDDGSSPPVVAAPKLSF